MKPNVSKQVLIIGTMLSLLLALTSCAPAAAQEDTAHPDEAPALTLSDVFTLAKEKDGSPITWADLGGYTFTKANVGPFIQRSYPIDDTYSLIATGASKSDSPAMIYLSFGSFDEEKIPFSYLEIDESLSTEDAISYFAEDIQSLISSTPVNVIRNPVDLFVGDDSNCAEALCYGRNWHFDISAVASTNNVGGASSDLEPLDNKGLNPEVFNTSNSKVSLLFGVNTQPDSIEITCYPDDSWGKSDVKGETITVSKNELYSFELKQGTWIYHIAATWDHSGQPENYAGTADYIFIGNRL